METNPVQIYGFLSEMELDFKRIERIEEIRGEKESLTREWMALAAPILNDVGLVRETYRIFTGILERLKAWGLVK